MDTNFMGLLNALIERAEKTVEELKSVKKLAHQVPGQEIGYAKEALWFVYWLWTSDQYKNLEAYAKEES